MNPVYFTILMILSEFFPEFRRTKWFVRVHSTQTFLSFVTSPEVHTYSRYFIPNATGIQARKAAANWVFFFFFFFNEAVVALADLIRYSDVYETC